MGLIRNNKLVIKFNEWRKRKRLEEAEYEPEDWNEVVYDRKDLNIHDKEQREEYVKSCLEQIADATKELENLNFEYSMVTNYLKDMEELEALPAQERRELEESAKKIEQLELQRGSYLEKKSRMSDEKFHQLDRMAEDAEEGIAKVQEAEVLQEKIRQDMGRLEGEKHAYLYRRHELVDLIADLKGITIICSVAFVICFVVLLLLQYGMGMDTQLGYLCASALAVLAIALLYFKYTESVREHKRVEKGINRLIMLHNRVKIRYVNNRNLLDYLYLKYQISSAKEFKNLWEQYLEEREERMRYRKAELELDENQQEFLTILKCYQIKDPSIWLHQTAAILDNKEMVEIRHGLIIRRQSLRRRLDYNKEVIASKAQEEIKDLVEKYPQYAKEILNLVGKYEKDFV